MAISKDNGVEAYEIHDRPINSTTFCQMFKEIDRKHGPNFHAFADSGSWHKSKQTTKFLEDRNTTMSINLVAVP
jgi:hypothetical protein